MTIENDENTDDNHSLTWIIKIAFGIVTVAIILSIILFLFETNFLTDVRRYDLSRIGSWGDAVGGILNPILSFLALIGLLWTIRLQSRELSYTRREIENSTAELKGSREANEKLVNAAEQQNIENAFFQLFNLLQDNLQTIKISQSTIGIQKSPETGARAFEVFAREVLNSISTRVSEIPENDPYKHYPDQREDGWEEILKLHDTEIAAKRVVLLEAYSRTYRAHQADLGRYFRLLYNVLRFLHDKENKIPKEMYETYYKIVRASISNYELFLIFANCLTDVGSPMKKYVSQFQLFDNLPRDYFLISLRDSYQHGIGELNLTELGHDFEKKSFGENLHFFENS